VFFHPKCNVIHNPRITITQSLLRVVGYCNAVFDIETVLNQPLYTWCYDRDGVCQGIK